MLQDLIIVGAGGSAREIAEVVEDINQDAPRWRLLGFLDDDPQKHGTTIDAFPVLGAIDTAANYPTCKFIIGIANAQIPFARRTVAGRMGLDRERFATLVHPTARVSRYAQLGCGTAILQGVIITTGSRIGDHVLVSQGASIAHDDRIEDYVTIAPGALISGAVHIGAGAYIGTGAQIMQRLEIGEAALVGIGAAVIANVAPGTTVFGNPARPLPRSS